MFVPLTRPDLPAALLRSPVVTRFPVNVAVWKSLLSDTQVSGQCLAHRPRVYDVQTHAYLICIYIMYRIVS